jgi:hypothetical protein
MELSIIEDYVIQARVAAVLGATVFDRTFAGVRFAETDGSLLYVLGSLVHREFGHGGRRSRTAHR